jgi:hypothetical protein
LANIFKQRREKDDLSTPPPFLKWMQICLVQERRSIRKLLNVIFPLFLPFLFLDDDDVKLTWIKNKMKKNLFSSLRRVFERDKRNGQTGSRKLK